MKSLTNTNTNINIHPSWIPLFNQYEFDFNEIYPPNETVYPPIFDLFKIFQINVTDIRIVLLGQDPYHGPDQAHGFSFSVPNNIKIPPSLRNIYKELLLEFPERNYKFLNGNLEQWVYREKIFLLNSALSVKRGEPGSHMQMWEEFTNDVIKFISNHNDKCVFLLLGNFAKSKEVFITNKLRIVAEKHPSPLARGFIGSNVFKRVEDALGEQINWSIC
jgi:uracil-DNA glycosylase